MSYDGASSSSSSEAPEGMEKNENEAEGESCCFCEQKFGSQDREAWQQFFPVGDGQ